MVTYCCSLAEQLESTKESFDEKNLSALSLFLECKKVSCYFSWFCFPQLLIRFSLISSFFNPTVRVRTFVLFLYISSLGVWFHYFGVNRLVLINWSSGRWYFVFIHLKYSWFFFCMILEKNPLICMAIHAWLSSLLRICGAII